jgi:predicted SAM-dependent methyltransferase
MLKKSANLLVRATEQLMHTFNGITKKCINIGCGSDIRPYWINCDIDPKHESVTKLDITNINDLQWLQSKSADIITSDHVIGYMTIAQADNFFRSCFACLKEGGVLIIEFPDLGKIVNQIQLLDYSSGTIDDDYIEIIRSIYAYDRSDAMSTNFDMKTYITGWTHEYLICRLKLIGFREFSVKNPKTHDRRIHRDTRIEAYK